MDEIPAENDTQSGSTRENLSGEGLSGNLLNASCLIEDAKERLRSLISERLTAEQAAGIAEHAVRNLEKADKMLEAIRDELREIEKG